MSLLDGLILDSLLNPPVVKQEVWFAIRTDGVKGAGTEKDPYNAAGTSTDSDPLFDQRMRELGSGITANAPMTIRLQPGTYYTKGYRSGAVGWEATSGMRIVGSGIAGTTLKLTTNLASSNYLVSAIGMDSTDFLENFEVSDLTIDANLPGNGATNLSVGGVFLNGRNIFATRVEVVNIGTKGTGDAAVGIGVANAQSGMDESYNCIVQNCIVRSAGVISIAGLIGIRLGTQTWNIFHRLCVIRDCFVDLGANDSTKLAYNYLAIEAGGGIGTIVECNQIRNCRYGVSWAGYLVGSGTTRDLIIQNNNFQNVAEVFCEQNAGSSANRLIIQNNTVEWPTAAHFSAPAGVAVHALVDSIIVRKNVFLRPPGTAPNNNEKGIHFENCTSIIVENNIADVGSNLTEMAAFSVFTYAKAFNNRKPDGTFVAGYNIDAGRFWPELTTEAENAILAI